MLIKNTRFNLVYPRINNLRRKAFEIEDKLEGYFHPLTLIPVPDEAPEEIPRMSTTSKNGHSQLNISLSNAQLVTEYSQDFENDWEKCLSYIEERIDSLFLVLSEYSHNEYLFSGLTTEIIFDNKEVENPISLLKEKFFNLKVNESIYELEQKLTFIVSEVYYLNITFKNLRVYDNIHHHTSGMLKNESAHYLLCILDINDRHGYNSKDNYQSNSDNSREVLRITKEMLNGKLKEIIEKGELNL